MSYRSKRIIALLGAALLTFSMVACGTNNAQDSTEEIQAAEEDTGAVLKSGSMFTKRDLNSEYDATTAATIDLADGASTSSDSSVTVKNNTVTITQAGTYVISGSLFDGQLVVDVDKDAEDKVHLVLNGVSITNTDSPAIYVVEADKVFITLVEGSTNTVTVSGEYIAADSDGDILDAAIYAKDDLTLNGTGSLSIDAAYGAAIVCKDDLVIADGTYNFTTSEGHAIKTNDSVRIAGGTLNLTSVKDGIHTDGFIYIAGGTINITSDGDGLDAVDVIQIEGGDFSIVSGGGIANAENHVGDFGKGFGGNFGGHVGPRGGDGATDGERPELPEGMQDGNMPQHGNKPEGGMPDENMSQQGDTQSPDGESTEGEADSTVGAAQSNKGIKSDYAIYISGGNFNIESAGDALHTNGEIQVDEGTLTIASGDDGMHSDTSLTINGGIIQITASYEGLEGCTISINGGDIDIVASDDGMNAATVSADRLTNSSFGVSEVIWIEINGGSVHVNAAGDGLDSNGDIIINGGEIYVDGPTSDGDTAVDYGDGAAAYIYGGTLVAVGSSGMAEAFDSSSTQGIILLALQDAVDGGEITLTDASGNTVISYTAAKRFSCVMISTADLEIGGSYTLTAGGNVQTIDLDDTVYSNIQGGFGGPGGMDRKGEFGDQDFETQDSQPESEVTAN